MIAPIFPADLERKTGMKNAARFLLKTWPGVKPVTHMKALDLLAKGLGYDSYHHVMKLASSWTDARPDIDIHSIEWNLSRVLSEEFQASDNPRVFIELGNLHIYIQAIPLHHLTVFKRFPELLEREHWFRRLPLTNNRRSGGINIVRSSYLRATGKFPKTAVVTSRASPRRPDLPKASGNPAPSLRYKSIEGNA